MFLRSSVLPFVLFLFEPFLAASLLLQVGPSLFQRDAATLVGVAARIALALVSVAAAIGLRDARPFGHRLALFALVSSSAFAVVQYATRVLPTNLAPDVAWLFTILIVIHQIFWIVVLLRTKNGDGIGAARTARGQ